MVCVPVNKAITLIQLINAAKLVIIPVSLAQDHLSTTVLHARYMRVYLHRIHVCVLKDLTLVQPLQISVYFVTRIVSIV